MCGIAGFVNARGEAEGAVLQEMLRRIAHRGPDGQGVFLEGRAALGTGGWPSSTWRAAPSPCSTRTGGLWWSLTERSTTIRASPKS